MFPTRKSLIRYMLEITGKNIVLFLSVSNYIVVVLVFLEMLSYNDNKINKNNK